MSTEQRFDKDKYDEPHFLSTWLSALVFALSTMVLSGDSSSSQHRLKKLILVSLVHYSSFAGAPFFSELKL
eukprot:SAG11_NODE_4050_length_2086_cov_2.008556_3_plen_71_part_00